MVAPFFWGPGGDKLSAAEVEKQRRIAEALLAANQQNPSNVGEGLTSIGRALAYNAISGRAAAAEREGRDAYSSQFSALGENPTREQLIGLAGNDFGNEGQSAVVQALLGQQLDPYSQQMEALKLKQAQLDYQQDAEGVGDTADAPSSVREWEYFNALPPDQQGAYLRMKRANPYLDVGTGFVQPDPVNPGQTSGGPIVKDNFTPSYDEAAGGAQAKVDVETQAAADSLASKMPGLRAVVGELSDIAKTATYTATGQIIDNVMRETGQEPSEAAIARTKYIAMVDNQILPLLRDTFGAAFTVKEGETLRATLGDPNKSPVEKQVILEAFIEQKARDLEALQSRLPSADDDLAGVTIEALPD